MSFLEKRQLSITRGKQFAHGENPPGCRLAPDSCNAVDFVPAPTPALAANGGLACSGWPPPRSACWAQAGTSQSPKGPAGISRQSFRAW